MTLFWDDAYLLHLPVIDAQHKQRDSKPKTVYFNRLDYTHGAPSKKPVTVE